MRSPASGPRDSASIIASSAAAERLSRSSLAMFRCFPHSSHTHAFLKRRLREVTGMLWNSITRMSTSMTYMYHPPRSFIAHNDETNIQP